MGHLNRSQKMEAGKMNGLADGISRRQSYAVLLEVAAGPHE
jgi:hypothetical protein